MAKTAPVRHPKMQQVENEQTMSDEMRTEQSDNAEVLSALEAMSSKQLTEVIDKATSLRSAKMEGEKKDFLERVRAEAAELGISLEQIMPKSLAVSRKTRSSGKSQASVKYHGPNENDTWTGRGRLPNWLAALEAEGRSRDEFLVEKAE